MKIHKLVSLSMLVLLLGACTTPQPKRSTLESEANYWQQVGSRVVAIGSTASLAQTITGIPVMAYSSYDGTSTNIYVKRWNGSSWVQLGSFLDANTNLNVYDPSLALDSSGNPVVSWSESDGTTDNIYVKHWNGTSWTQLGTTLDVNTNQYARNPSLALDSSGNPVVSWQEWDGTSYNIYVKRWDGTIWVQLGTVSDAKSGYRPSLALDGSGNPVVSWVEDGGNISDNIYVKRWNGSSWVQLGGFLDANPDSDSYDPSLALDSSGNPVVSWQESSNIYVKRWNGASWIQLGTTLDYITNQDASRPSLALDSSDNPVVSWTEYGGVTSHNIYVKAWNGTSWTLIGTNALDTNIVHKSLYSSLSLVNGSLAVAWQERSYSSGRLYVKKYITKSWQDMGSLLDVAGDQSAVNSSVARSSSNSLVVAWDEDDSATGSRNVYVKKWTGSAWSSLGGALDKVLGADAENPSIALTSNGTAAHVAWQENGNIYEKFWHVAGWITEGAARGGALDTTLANNSITPSLAIRTDNLPVVAYAENGDVLVKQLVGTTWTAIGSALDTTLANEAYRPSLALKTDNNPIVAWYEDSGTSFNIYAKEWNGTSWVALGTTIDKTVTRDAKDIVLAIRTDNRPVVAWEEAGNVYVKRWTGTSWVSIGGTLDKTAGNEALRPALDLRSDNNPVVSWQEWNGSSYDVFVKRWTGSTWALVANVADKNLSRDAERPALVLKSDNNPIISWDEWDGTSENIYVRQF
jgi:hypothetical protein